MWVPDATSDIYGFDEQHWQRRSDPCGRDHFRDKQAAVLILLVENSSGFAGCDFDLPDSDDALRA